MLARQAQPVERVPLSYREYIDSFEADDPRFYPARRQVAGGYRTPIHGLTLICSNHMGLLFA